MDLQGVVHRTAGGATGYGWELGLVAGVAYDVEKLVKPSVGFGAVMRRSGAQDGDFGSTGLEYHGRLDVTVSSGHISAEEWSRTHPTMTIPSGGADARTRLTLDYGWGKYEKLYFKPDGSEMTYEPRFNTHSFYLGIAREYDIGIMTASYGIGPSVTLMPNDFVGDTTAIGLQAHTAFWFIPVFKTRPTGSVWDHYSGPKPIEQGPEAPGPVMCRDRDTGTTQPCN